MSKWEITKYINGLESNIDAGLDIVGKFIADEETNATNGLYGQNLLAYDQGALSAGYTFDRPNKTTVRNGNPVEYAIYVELGTGKFNPQGRKGGWRYKDSEGNWHFTYGMRPRPIMQTVVQTNDDEIMDILGRACAK